MVDARPARSRCRATPAGTVSPHRSPTHHRRCGPPVAGRTADHHPHGEPRSAWARTAPTTSVGHRTHPTSGHRLRLGLQGSLILFAPPAFIPQRPQRTRRLPSPLVFQPRSSHFNGPWAILSSPSVRKRSRRCTPSSSSDGWKVPRDRRLRILYAQCDITLALADLPRLLARQFVRTSPTPFRDRPVGPAALPPAREPSDRGDR